MTFAEWISAQIDALRAMITPETDEDPSSTSSATAGDSFQETRTAEKITWRFQSNPSNLSRARKSMEKFCSDAGLDTPACDEIGLVVNEAVANVIRHAYANAKGRPIEMEGTRLTPGVRITIRDWGNGVNPADEMPTDKDLLIPGGLGLICMQHLMDEMKFLPQPDGMLLVMTRTTMGSKAAMFDGREKKQA